MPASEWLIRGGNLALCYTFQECRMGEIGRRGCKIRPKAKELSACGKLRLQGAKHSPFDQGSAPLVGYLSGTIT